MTGGGRFGPTKTPTGTIPKSTVYDNKAIISHGFELHCNSLDKPNNLELNFNINQSEHNVKLVSLTYALCYWDPIIDPKRPLSNFNTYIGRGTALMDNKAGYNLAWKFTDAGEPGSKDWAEITITAPDGTQYKFHSTLHFGNQQAHKANCNMKI